MQQQRSDRLRIASRGSRLALWQVEHLIQLIATLDPSVATELVEVTTTGDIVRDRPLRDVGGKDVFITEVQRVLLEGRADVALHCLKDYPSAVPAGFHIAAVLPRASELDVLLSRRPAASLADLPAAPLIGTSSLRRAFLLRRLLPGARIALLRGNIDTRLARLNAGDFDAIVLAQAGLDRLGLTHHSILPLAREQMPPAAGQGTLVVEIREDREDLRRFLAPLNDAEAATTGLAEKAFVHRLAGNCSSIMGAFASIEDGLLKLEVFAGDEASGADLRASDYGSVDEPAALGNRLADRLLAEGAVAFLPR